MKRKLKPFLLLQAVRFFAVSKSGQPALRELLLLLCMRLHVKTTASSH
jgi:hypothetical protein